jgi:hypothetical protein
MSEPLVACVMLMTPDRKAMASRACDAYNRQTYARRRMVIWYNTGGIIGTLRNEANEEAVIRDKPDIIIHWDSDDVSHPNRIAEQVALLQSSGKDCVGYREVLFWREPRQVYVGEMQAPLGPHPVFELHDGEAWLYSNRDTRYCIGASLCYWRRVWERHPFPALPKNRDGSTEDNVWLRGVDSMGELSRLNEQWEPRLICSIHGGNSQAYNIEATISRGATEWRRVPEWDSYLRGIMALPGGEPTLGASSERTADAMIRPALPGGKP